VLSSAAALLDGLLEETNLSHRNHLTRLTFFLGRVETEYRLQRSGHAR